MTSPLVPSEFDLEFEAGRARLLRRRFLFFCAVMIALSAIGLVFLYIGWVRGKLSGRPPLSFQLTDTLVAVSAYALAAAYAWQAPPRSRTLLRAVFWLVVLTCWWSLGTARVADWLYRPPSEGAKDYARGAISIILANHFLASLFIRWSVRESLATGLALLAPNALLVTADLAMGHARTAVAVYLVLSPLAVAPGVLVCWWRYSRLRDLFRLQFESTRYRRLQTELASARRVHESCLAAKRADGPVRLSYVYEPMREIGGDLIFVHTPPGSDGSTLSVVVLDVTGHGIAAALTVNRLVGELERLFAESPTAAPADIVCGLNRYVALTLSRHDIYATALCVSVDAGQGMLSWCSGGHPTAFLRHNDGRIETLASTAPLLGIDGPAEFCTDQPQAAFEPGDCLVCYTDGATEAQNHRGEQLGTAGVERLLRYCTMIAPDPGDWPADMLRGIIGHRNAPPGDDTLIAVLFRPRQTASVARAAVRPGILDSAAVPQPVA